MSAKTPKHPELFPVVLGNEEESMLLTGTDERTLADPNDFVANFADYAPKGLKGAGGIGVYWQNGSLTYDGGVSSDNADKYEDNVNLERATPECSTPRELATYVEASENMYVTMLKNFVEKQLIAGEPTMARAQRRVISYDEQTRGCHDNIEARQPEFLGNLEKLPGTWAVLHTYLATRGIMTGAGYVAEGVTHFTQKTPSITHLSSYNYGNSAVRAVAGDKDSTGPRLEIRCNDINISPWAIQARIGGAALLYTLLHTPIVDELKKHVPFLENETQVKNMYYRFSVAPMDEDGQLQASHGLLSAIDFQERVAEVMDQELGKYIDISDEYQTLIYEMGYYIQDLRRVVVDGEPLEQLADRADFAAKFSAISRRRRTHPWLYLDPEQALLQDMAMDMKYDSIIVKPDESGKAKITEGYGIAKRRRGDFRLSIPEPQVERAVYYPPQTTRAKPRGEMIRKGDVELATWSSVKLRDEKIHIGLGSPWLFLKK